LGVLLVILGLSATAQADVIYETHDPFGSVFGVMGWDVSRDQSVAVRFTPGGRFTLGELQLWLWNNDGTGGTPKIVITLRDDQKTPDGSVPGDTVLERWVFAVPNTGVFNPVRFDFAALYLSQLDDGVNYWITAESDAVGGYDPVWAIAGEGTGSMSFKCPPTGPWSPAHSGEVASVIVLGTRVSLRGDLNCDGALNFDDVNAFVLALSDPAGYRAAYPTCGYLLADINADGAVTFDDIDPFVAILSGGR
jgi:hypothetical protein